jgi:hypothetical protein
MPLMREWIVFALCLGFGGHIALAFVLHAPEVWPWSRAGLYGIFSGLVVYALVQLVRFLWQSMRKTDLTDTRSADL